MILLRQLWNLRHLLFSLVKRDLKVRYKGSVLGFFWSFGRPLFLMLILTTVFSLIIPIGYDPARAQQIPFALFLLSGILCWMYTAGSLHEGVNVLHANASLIRKVAINSAVFPAASVVGNLVHLVLAFSIYLLFLLWFGRGVSPAILLMVPVLAIQTLLVLALVMLASSLNVFYRDVGSLTELLITGWFYLTPILYPVDLALREIATRFPHHATTLQAIYLLNPMAPVAIAYRRALLAPPPDMRELPDAELLAWLGISGAVSLGLFVVASRVFRARCTMFADEL